MSLLPDCFAARRSGTLDELEAEVLAVERAASLAAAAAVRRPDSELPGALRWLGRARSDVHAALSIVRALLPERFEAAAPSLTAFAAALGLDVDAGAAPGVLREHEQTSRGASTR